MKTLAAAQRAGWKAHCAKAEFSSDLIAGL